MLQVKKKTKVIQQLKVKQVILVLENSKGNNKQREILVLAELLGLLNKLVILVLLVNQARLEIQTPKEQRVILEAITVVGYWVCC